MPNSGCESGIRYVLLVCGSMYLTVVLYVLQNTGCISSLLVVHRFTSGRGCSTRSVHCFCQLQNVHPMRLFHPYLHIRAGLWSARIRVPVTLRERAVDCGTPERKFDVGKFIFAMFALPLGQHAVSCLDGIIATEIAHDHRGIQSRRLPR